MTQGSAQSSGASTPPARAPRTNWGMRIIIGIVLVVFAAIAFWLLSAFLPIWWANTIAQQVGGNLGGGVLLGLIYGFAFTFVPLLVLWQIRHRRVSWAWKGVLTVLAVLLSSPNLLTLGIMVGNSEAAHNAQRIIGTSATWFPQWTMTGAIIAGVLFFIFMIWSLMWSKRGRDMRKLKEQRHAAERDRDELRASVATREESARTTALPETQTRPDTARNSGSPSASDSAPQRDIEL